MFIKKIYRIIYKYIIFILLKLFNLILLKSDFSIIPTLNKVDFSNFIYSKNTRRLVFHKNNNLFNRIVIDSSLSETKLCKLGKKYQTNKSSINIEGARSGYTTFFTILFSSFRDKKINVAEIGIEKNGSIKLWREYFKKAVIYAFEFEKKKIELAKRHKLKKTYYYEINVHDKKSIYSSFQKTKVKFDLIIDDSTHIFDDQIRVIKNCYKFLKTNGIMIIEDIYRFRSGYQDHKYFNELSTYKKYFHEIFFIETKHVNNFTASWRNEKILLLLRNNLK
jgi:SAM-dependent methyltransferase